MRVMTHTSETGHIYVFDEMWVSSVYGRSMSGSYNCDKNSGFVDLEKIIDDPQKEYESLLAGEIDAIEAVRTDSDNLPVYSVVIEYNAEKITTRL